MTMSILSRNRAEPVSTIPAAAPAATIGIRALLRDTALAVAALSTGGLVEDYERFRDRCRQLVTGFNEALREHAYPNDVREDAIAAQCALIDEAALRHLDDGKKAQWINEPLQVEQLKYHNAGEYVFERIDMRMREPRPNLDLLECYAAILGLGFKGRYALEGQAARTALIARLDTLIGQLRPARQPELLIERQDRRFGDWFRRLSPWAIAGAGFIIALVVWLVWHVALDAQLAAIAPRVIKP
jgi:type VI secretion system protein ImpK